MASTKPPSKDELFGAHLKSRGTLIRYLVESGEMSTKIMRAYPADAEALALLALDACRFTKFGALVCVSGGNYVGPNVMYLDTMGLLKRLGRLVPPDEKPHRPTSASRKKAR